VRDAEEELFEMAGSSLSSLEELNEAGLLMRNLKKLSAAAEASATVEHNAVDVLGETVERWQGEVKEQHLREVQRDLVYVLF
jgi:hypothetical protein